MRFTRLFSWCLPNRRRASRGVGSDSRGLAAASLALATAGLRSTEFGVAAVLPVGVEMSRRQYVQLIEQAFADMSHE